MMHVESPQQVTLQFDDPSQSHAATVLYPAIKRAMELLAAIGPEGKLVNAAFNVLHDAYWSECPCPADELQKRTEPCDANQA